MVIHSSELLEISVNGEMQKVPAGLTVRRLLLHLELAPDRVAVEFNGAIVRQPDWDVVIIGNGAVLEIVQFVGGG
jgi:thiamine biosynthesis protein ThiS